MGWVGRSAFLWGLLLPLAQYSVASTDQYPSLLILSTDTSPNRTYTGSGPPPAVSSNDGLNKTSSVSPVVRGVRSSRDTGSQGQGAQLGPRAIKATDERNRNYQSRKNSPSPPHPSLSRHWCEPTSSLTTATLQSTLRGLC